MAVLFILVLTGYRTPFKNQSLNLAWDFFCLAVALSGEGIRFFTVGFVPRGTSGRNTKGQVADTLNTTGMYAVVRNPLYLGNLIIWCGLSLFIKLWWFTALVILFFLVFYERIIFAEERFLREKFGDGFLQWAKQTPAIIPNFKNWRPPSLPFSWESALVREYGSFYAIIVAFTMLELLGGLCASGKFSIDAIWIKIFIASTIFYLTVRYLKKRTKVLATANR
ncbi:MAG: isoprenylcysteine carboxylmethyltransferase family protein [Deltaproteobacteria bacterium]